MRFGCEEEDCCFKPDYRRRIKSVKPRKNKWTLQLLKEKAALYSNKTDFRAGEAGAYQSAARQGYLEEICQHMYELGNITKRCVYELRAGNQVYVGLTYDFNKRIKEHRNNKTVGNGLFDAVMLTDYISALEAMKIEKQLIKINISSTNLISTNKNSGGALGPHSKELSCPGL